MELVKCKDIGLHTYTYFWIDRNKKVLSPYFESSDQAYNWQRDFESRYLDSVKNSLKEEEKRFGRG